MQCFDVHKPSPSTKTRKDIVGRWLYTTLDGTSLSVTGVWYAALSATSLYKWCVEVCTDVVDPHEVCTDVR